MNTKIELTCPLPYTWDESDDGQATAQNDQGWLNGIAANAAPFSDWWTKARIVQMAYAPTYGADPAIYTAYRTVDAIAKALVEEILTYGQAFDVVQGQAMYPGFFEAVDPAFVIKTLNSCQAGEFTKAISRNFEVYRYLGKGDTAREREGGDRCSRNTFLVLSTASVSLSVERTLPPSHKFRPLFNVEELAHIIHDRGIQSLTLRTHGYANPALGFFKFLAQEANVLFADPKPNAQAFDTLADKHLYIGYHWPSEMPLFNASLTRDSLSNLEVLFKFLISVLVLSFIPSGVLIALTRVFERLRIVEPAGWQWDLAIAAGVFFLWLSLLMLLRGVVYLRDRYRAVHYGAPDLAEFFWRLDQHLKQINLAEMPPPKPLLNPEADRQWLAKHRKQVNLIGHSMGGLVVVNMLRVLSDRFGKDDLDSYEDGGLGDCLRLGKIILASPDIPLELLREGRNNYVRSAIRRCEQIYLMSSDRDIVLRYLSTLGNWFTEPSIEMSGLRLGNIFLPPDPAVTPTPRRRRRRRERLQGLQIRGAIIARAAVRPTSAFDLFENFSYLDCSKMVGLNGVALELNPLTAIPIDIINSFLYLIGRIDVHGGYFFVYTPTFKLLPFLMQAKAPTEAEVREQLARWDPQQTMLRFLYRVTPTPGSKDAEPNAGSSAPETDDPEIVDNSLETQRQGEH